MRTNENKPLEIRQAAKTAGTELIQPKTSSVETARLYEHQRDALVYMQHLRDIACDDLKKHDPVELIGMQCIVTAKIHYGFPHHPAIMSPNFFIYQMDDYAVLLTKRQAPRDYDQLIFGDTALAQSENALAVYPNYVGFLMWWIKNIEGPIHETRCYAQPSRSFNLDRTLPLGTLNIEGSA